MHVEGEKKKEEHDYNHSRNSGELAGMRPVLLF